MFKILMLNHVENSILENANLKVTTHSTGYPTNIIAIFVTNRVKNSTMQRSTATKNVLIITHIHKRITSDLVIPPKSSATNGIFQY